jgi:hypothetical protein
MSKKTNFTFYVGTSSDPRLARQAVVGLRAIVRLGKEAEKTLKDLRENGYSDRRTCWLKRVSHKYNHLVDNKFPKAVSLTRADVPGYGPISINLIHSGEKNGHSRSRSNEFHVMAKLPSFDGGKWGEKDMNIGTFRITKRRGSFRIAFPDFRGCSSAWRPNSFSITKDGHPVHRDRIAHAISEHIVGENLIKEPYSAELARQIQIWLIEDGFIDKLTQYLWQFSKDQILVKRIMTE